MIQFILNSQLITTDLPGGTILLDFIRKEEHLPGTKIGCREGDCGACAVLEGSLGSDKQVHYQTITSCLTPIANVHGKHVVTVEGLTTNKELNQVQRAMKTHNATQCGFCTPGFVVAFTGYTLNKDTSIKGLRDSISGNICRCTGYKSIEKAANQIFEEIKNGPKSRSLPWLIKHHFVPQYFQDIPSRLEEIAHQPTHNKDIIVGGGTDLYVQKAELLYQRDLMPVRDIPGLQDVVQTKSKLTLGAGLTPTHLLENKLVMAAFPKFQEFFQLVSSQVIRNMGTIGGNMVNASPIGDLSVLFLALNADVELLNLKSNLLHTIPLKKFFLDYKKTALQTDEIIRSVTVDNSPARLINFEKVSKRTHLDIASVNSAMSIKMNGNEMAEVHLSAGGVAPVPLYLKNTCAFLTGKTLNEENLRKAHCVLKEEIAPISDVRGSAKYKRLLLRQLFYAHFIKLFPNKIKPLTLLNMS